MPCVLAASCNAERLTPVLNRVDIAAVERSEKHATGPVVPKTGLAISAPVRPIPASRPSGVGLTPGGGGSLSARGRPVKWTR